MAKKTDKAEPKKTMLYKHGGSETFHKVACQTRVVEDADEIKEALADGWHESPQEAAEAAPKTSVLGDQKK